MSYTVLHADAFEDNYIWLIVADDPKDDGPRPVVIIDPGDEIPVFEKIEHENLNPVAILCTHGCLDHVGGISDIARRFKLPVYGPAEENIPALYHPKKACRRKTACCGHNRRREPLCAREPTTP